MFNPIKKIAIHRVKNSGNDYLIQWWVDRYSLPRNHELLLNLTWEELYLEYITDFYSKNPNVLKEDIEFLEMGDELYDKEWKGQTSEEYEKKIQEKLRKITQVDLSKWQEDIDKKRDEFDDDFSKES